MAREGWHWKWWLTPPRLDQNIVRQALSTSFNDDEDEDEDEDQRSKDKNDDESIVAETKKDK